jgi:hypothetical protein
MKRELLTAATTVLLAGVLGADSARPVSGSDIRPAHPITTPLNPPDDSRRGPVRPAVTTLVPDGSREVTAIPCPVQGEVIECPGGTTLTRTIGTGVDYGSNFLSLVAPGYNNGRTIIQPHLGSQFVMPVDATSAVVIDDTRKITATTMPRVTELHTDPDGVTIFSGQQQPQATSVPCRVNEVPTSKFPHEPVLFCPVKASDPRRTVVSRNATGIVIADNSMDFSPSFPVLTDIDAQNLTGYPDGSTIKVNLKSGDTLFINTLPSGVAAGAFVTPKS